MTGVGAVLTRLEATDALQTVISHGSVDFAMVAFYI